MHNNPRASTPINAGQLPMLCHCKSQQPGASPAQRFQSKQALGATHDAAQPSPAHPLTAVSALPRASHGTAPADHSLPCLLNCRPAAALPLPSLISHDRAGLHDCLHLRCHHRRRLGRHCRLWLRHRLAHRHRLRRHFGLGCCYRGRGWCWGRCWSWGRCRRRGSNWLGLRCRQRHW